MTVAESGLPKYTVWNVAILPLRIAIIHTKVAPSVRNGADGYEEGGE